MLTSPGQPITYKGPMAVLVNHGTGSASETLSGVLQSKRLAEIIGQQTAGAVYLKNIYDFEDNSALFMITSLTYYPDRRAFAYNGITPDIAVPEKADALQIALEHIR